VPEAVMVDVAEFTHERRKYASSLEGTYKLTEEGIYVPEHVGTKNQINKKKLDAIVGSFMNRNFTMFRLREIYEIL
jgi:hypothetical protein